MPFVILLTTTCLFFVADSILCGSNIKHKENMEYTQMTEIEKIIEYKENVKRKKYIDSPKAVVYDAKTQLFLRLLKWFGK